MPMSHKRAKKHPSVFWFEGDIKKIVTENMFFRRAVYTGEYSQLMLMSIPKHRESGEEKQEGADKILFIVKGRGKSTLNGRVREIRKHDVIFVPAGNLHNLANAGDADLKLFVVYSPPLYADGMIYKTPEDAMAGAAKQWEHAWEQ